MVICPPPPTWVIFTVGVPYFEGKFWNCMSLIQKVSFSGERGYNVDTMTDHFTAHVVIMFVYDLIIS